METDAVSGSYQADSLCLIYGILYKLLMYENYHKYWTNPSNLEIIQDYFQ